MVEGDPGEEPRAALVDDGACGRSRRPSGAAGAAGSDRGLAVVVVVGVEARVEDELVAGGLRVGAEHARPRRRSSRPSGTARRGGRRRSTRRGRRPRGSPSGRYGVSPWRWATQPQEVRLSNVRAQPMSAPGNSRWRARGPAPLRRESASASRKTTTGRVASLQPEFRAPPAKACSLRDDRAPAASATAPVRSRSRRRRR